MRRGFTPKDISPLRGEDRVTADYYKHSTTAWLFQLLRNCSPSVRRAMFIEPVTKCARPPSGGPCMYNRRTRAVDSLCTRERTRSI